MAGDGERAGGGSRPRGGLQLWNLKAPEWRTAAWLGGLLVLGLVLLLARPAAAPGSAALPAAAAPAAAPGDGADPLAAEEAAMAADLAGALDRIAGAGTVTVRVHLAAGAQTQYATNAQDSDSATSGTGAGGGLQTTTQKTTSTQVVVATSGAPVVSAVQAPAVDGVLIVAPGASSGVVRAELAAAAQAVTGAPLYSITVVPAQEGTADGPDAGAGA